MTAPSTIPAPKPVASTFTSPTGKTHVNPHPRHARARDRAQLVVIAYKHGPISPPEPHRPFSLTRRPVRHSPTIALDDLRDE